jgi:hypothetical protein
MKYGRRLRCVAVTVALGFGIMGGATSLGCSPQNNANYAKVPVAVGLAVAQAGFQRAVTGSCWAQCEMGTRCNESSGLCEPDESFVKPVKAATPETQPSPVATADDSCAGYCLSDERCVLVADGDIQCVPAK